MFAGAKKLPKALDICWPRVPMPLRMMQFSSVTCLEWPASRMSTFRTREHHQTALYTGVYGVLERVKAPITQVLHLDYVFAEM